MKKLFEDEMTADHEARDEADYLRATAAERREEDDARTRESIRNALTSALMLAEDAATDIRARMREPRP